MANLAGILSRSIDETNLLILAFDHDLVPFGLPSFKLRLNCGRSRSIGLCFPMFSSLAFYVAIEKGFEEED